MRFHALPGTVLDKVRANKVSANKVRANEVSANKVRANGEGDQQIEFQDAEGGELLRCCLRDAEAGERIILFGYEPPLPLSPYREIGPVFAHASPCTTAPDEHRYPSDWRHRPQVLRAYDENGRIHPASRTHDGADPEGAIAAVLAEPGVVQIHSRNIAYGCYMFKVTTGEPS